MRNRLVSTLVAAATLAPLLAMPVTALAATKVWVSNAGADSGTCGAVTSPCATFQQAHNNVAAGGEVGVLTPGDYGPLSTFKSVNVTNDGSGEAASSAIFVSAGRGDIISLRGLVMDGQHTGGIGISVSTVSALHIQNCVVRNFQMGFGTGILFSNSGVSQLFVSDTLVSNNGTTLAAAGILIAPGGPGSSANAVLDRVHVENNGIGLTVNGTSSTGVQVVLRDSVVSGNAGDGIAVETAGPLSFVLVERTASVNNGGNGIFVIGPHALVLMHGNVVSRNGTGLNAGPNGQLISYGTNKVNNNLGADGTPTSTFRPM